MFWSQILGSEDLIQIGVENRFESPFRFKLFGDGSIICASKRIVMAKKYVWSTLMRHPFIVVHYVQRAMWQKNNLGRPPARFINRSLKRSTATHVAAISHLPQIQALLPQFVLLNKRTFKGNDIPSSLPEGLIFIRDVSGWNTAEKMVLILEHIAKALISCTTKYQVVVLLDVASCHIDTQVISAANRLNLWLMHVPARLTFMLQPLDVACLQAYKSALNQLFVERQDNDGTLRTKEWFNVLVSKIKEFLWKNRTLRLYDLTHLRSIDILKKLWFLFKLFSKADSEKIDSNCLGKGCKSVVVRLTDFIHIQPFCLQCCMHSSGIPGLWLPELYYAEINIRTLLPKGMLPALAAAAALNFWFSSILSV